MPEATLRGDTQPRAVRDQRRKRADGVRKLADIKARCRIDGACWRWALAMSDNGKHASTRTARVHIPPGVLRPTKYCTSAGRAAWLLSGKPLADGQVVWRTCCHDDCCAPAHLMAGTKAEEGAWMAANGHRRGDPRRAAVNMLNVARTQAVSAEIVASVAQQLAAGGVLQREVAAQWGLHLATVNKIARGKHLHQRGAVRGSSVFNLGGAPR